MLPSVVPRLTTDLAVRVFPGVWKLLSFLRLPSWDGVSSLPLLSLFFVFYIFSYLLSKTMGCFSGCLMSSASIHKLFCGIYSEFKCSFDEFVGEKVVSLSYSSSILGLPLYFLLIIESDVETHNYNFWFFYFFLLALLVFISCILKLCYRVHLHLRLCPLDILILFFIIEFLT